MGYLSDARCMTSWQGVVGELVPQRGRGVAGALLQLVPQLGHLRAGWKGKRKKKGFKSCYNSF